MLSDDLAQETFIKAYNSLATFKNRANFQTWLFRIAYNIFYDYLRTRKEMTSPDDAALDELHADENHDVGKAYDIEKALAVLNADERTCVTLQIIEDQPVDRIVIITGMPEGTVKSHLSRGKKKLATYLKLHGYDR